MSDPGKHTDREVMLRTMSLGGRGLETNDLAILVADWHPFEEMSINPSYSDLMCSDDCVWDIINANDIEFTGTLDEKKNLIKLINEIYQSSNDTSNSVALQLYLVYQSAIFSVTNKTAMHSDNLVDTLLDLIEGCSDELVFKVLFILVLSFAELGLSKSQMRTLFQVAYADIQAFDLVKRSIVSKELLNSSLLFTDFEQEIQFTDLQISNVKSNLVISSWLKLRHSLHHLEPETIDEGFKLINLTKSDGSPYLQYSIQNEQLRIDTARDTYCFNCFTFEREKLYNISLVHSKYGRNTTKIEVFVNGIAVGFKLVSSFYSINSIQKLFPGPNTVTSLDLKISGPLKHRNMCFELGALYIIETDNSMKWVEAINFLGGGYRGQFKDPLLLESIASNEIPDKMKFQTQTSLIYDSKQDNLVFQFNEIDDSKNFSFYKNGKLCNHSQKFPIFVKHTIPLIDTFDSLGGSIYCLEKIANSSTNEQLSNNLAFLFDTLNSSNHLRTEFFKMYGFEVLALLIKKKSNLISIDVMDKILVYCGYIQEHPENSLIRNKHAYNCLILNFQLWNTLSSEQSTEIKKFFLYQFTVFFQASKYSRFNKSQMSNFKVVKKILLAIKRGTFTNSTFPVVTNVLWILVRDNSSSDVLKILQLHSMYMAYHKNDNLLLEGGEIALEVIQMIVDEKPKLINLLSLKFLLSMLNGSKMMKKTGLRLLLGLLNNNSRHYNSFAMYGGFNIISKFLDCYYDDNDFQETLLAASLGIPINFNQIGIKETLESEENLQLTKPHYFSAMNNLLIYAATDTDIARSDKVLVNYCKLLESLFHKVKFDKHFYGSTEVIGKLLFLSLIIKEKRSSQLFQKYSKVLSQVLIDTLYADDIGQAFAYLGKLRADYPVEFDHIVVPLLLTKTEQFPGLLDIILTKPDNYISLTHILDSYFQFSTRIDLNIVESLSVYDKTSDIIHMPSHDTNIDRKIIVSSKRLSASYVDSFTKLLLYVLLKHSEGSDTYDYITIFNNFGEVFMRNSDIFEENLVSKDKILLLVMMLKISTIIGISSLISNCLRTIIFVFSDIEEATSQIEIEKDGDVTFFEILTTIQMQSDEEMSETITNSVILQQFVTSQMEKNKVWSETNLLFSVTRESVESYILQVISNDKSSQLIEKEIHPFGTQVMKIESKIVTSRIQDEYDDYCYYETLFESLKSNISIDSVEWYNVLSANEGLNRKRNKMVNMVSDDTQKKMATYDLHKQSTFDLRDLETSINCEMTDSLNEFILNDEPFEEDKNRRIIRNLFVDDKIDYVFNVTQILGLDTKEMILIIGITHVYLVEGYFYSKSGELYYDYQAPDNERDGLVKLLTSVSINTNDGDDHIAADNGKSRKHKSETWFLKDLVSVSKKRFLLRDVGFELLFKNGASVLLTCVDNQKRNQVYSKLKTKIVANVEDANLEEALKLASQQKVKKFANIRQHDASSFSLMDSLLSNTIDISTSGITERWCNGEISNFQYLMLLNTVAGRTLNDLTQYHVVPFVLADYSSDTIDLNDPAVFRDLTKPMGAQTPEREILFRERYEATNEMSADTPPFHYGTHYSSAMIVCSYLIRLNPFTKSYLKLQGGRFDHPDRLFYSISKLWSSATGDNTTDVRELIPEFYYLPEFLKNRNNIQFGRLQDGNEVNDVKLPPWADKDPVKFVNIMRAALESPYVSERLPEWIDLIFGYKQQGEEAVKSTNLFHYLSYPGSVDLESIHDEHERAVIVSIIHNFGQTPLQIFRKKHPMKKTFDCIDLRKKFDDEYEDKFIFKINSDEVVNDVYYDRRLGSWTGNGNILKRFNGDKSKEQFQIEQTGCSSVLINSKYHYEKLSAGGNITVFEICGKNKFLLGFENGIIRIYEFTNNKFNCVKNAHRSIVNDERKRNGKQNEWMIQNTVTFRDRHNSAVIKVKYLFHEELVFALDEERNAIVVWYDNDKIGSVYFTGKLMVDDEKIVDFDVDENTSCVYAITKSGKLIVWRINGDVVGQYDIGVVFDKISFCGNYGMNDYQLGQLIALSNSTGSWVYSIDFITGVWELVKELVVPEEYNDIKMGYVNGKIEVCFGMDDGLVVYR